MSPEPDITFEQNLMIQRPFFSSLVSSASESRTPNVTDAPDLIYFLGLAQHYKIGFLPITWQPALGTIGGGATSHIAESLLSLQTNLAFKRVSRKTEQEQDMNDEAVIYRTLLAELSILAYPYIRNHPGVIRLEGICWEIDNNTLSALPVFVFEKAHHGDLQSFIDSDRGAALGYQDRLRLCAQVADAIAVLHSHGIVHGDIKPKNVLVYKEGEKYAAKIADFGFSTRTSKDGMVALPSSVPWYAPEHHPRMFTFAAAQKTDMFSFGLLCLWVLFRENLRAVSTSPQSKPKGENSSLPETLPAEYILLEQSKTNRELVELAHRLLESTEMPDHPIRHNLREFFSLTLSHDADSRAKVFPQLLPFLWQAPVIFWGRDVAESLQSDLAATEFRITKHLHQLKETDIRVWNFITKKLQQHAENSTNKESAFNAAFQLAFCYNIGFGVRRNEAQMKAWLGKSNKLAEDLEIEKHMLDPYFWSSASYSQKVNMWNNKGYFNTVDHVHEYQKAKSLKSIEADYLNLIRDLEEGLGRDHFMAVCQKEILSRILEAEGRYSEAEKLLTHIMELIEKGGSSSPDPNWSEPIHHELARILRRQDKLDDAERLLRTAIADENLSSLLRLLDRTLLGSILRDQGRYEMAKVELLEASEGCKELFGERHPRTITTLSHLAVLYDQLNQRDKAVEVHRRLFTLSQDVFERESLPMVGVYSNLARSLKEINKYAEAKEMGEQAVKIAEGFLGSDHEETLTAQGNLGYILSCSGDPSHAAASEELLLRAVAGLTSLIGSNHPKSLVNLRSLAWHYGNQGKYEAAEEAYRKHLEGTRLLYGDDDLQTFGSKLGLARSLHKRRKHQEAQDLCEQVLAGCESKPTKDSRAVQQACDLLAQIYNKEWNYEASVKMAQRSFELAKGIWAADDAELAKQAALLSGVKSRLALQMKAKSLGFWPSSPRAEDIHAIATTLASVDATADDMLNRGEYKEVEEILLALLMVRGTIHEIAHADLLKSASKVSFFYMKVHKYAFADNYTRMAMGLAMQLLGKSHPDTIALTRRLARIFQLQGHYAKAMNLHSVALRNQIPVPGDPDQQRMDAIDRLAVLLLRQKNLGETERLAMATLDRRTKLLGDAHPDTLASMNTLTRVWRESGAKAEQAKALNRRTLDACTRTLGDCHPHTLRAEGHRAANLACDGEFAAAEALSRRVLQGLERVLGEHDPETLEQSAFLGMLLYRQGKFAEAEEMYRKLVDATWWSGTKDDPISQSRERVLGRIRERVADPWDGLGEDGMVGV